MRVIIEISVGESPGQLSLEDAESIAAAAHDLGATGLLIADATAGRHGIDPSVVGAHLAARHERLHYVIEAPTTGNAPYNLARRILSLDRATGGRTGLLLRPGGGDEVSDAVAPGPAASPEDRWSEYAEILTELWESFPANALRGDQRAGIVADDTLIRPIDHEGAFYRVAGPLDGPSSPQGRPPLFAADPGLLGWDRVAAIADAVIVPAGRLADAAAELADAAGRHHRRRSDIALSARLDATTPVATVAGWADTGAADGAVLVASADVAATIDRIQEIVPLFAQAPDTTLRTALHHREIVAAHR
ncbi:LLM class flavin-dependent oxidoreductase [Gordonia sp. DT30]|uniref:LLM class flavin-dependent oxidoreductase n=1 Tax=unclassified Gordonia (in: high G+C Gram-positive bacteria) TaxID=2657482 RepID=UPI003CF95B5A